MVHTSAEPAVESRLRLIQQTVARPWQELWDAEPALAGEGLLVGSMIHAADVDLLARLGVTAVLNCSPGHIRKLPRCAYEQMGIRYAATNVQRDDHSYPILREAGGARSEHLATALECYSQARAEGGKVLFFCVAGQNRAPTLATAVLLLSGATLGAVLARFAALRPFVLENVHFQQQLVELELRLERLEGTEASADGAAFGRPGLGAEQPLKCWGGEARYGFENIIIGM